MSSTVFDSLSDERKELVLRNMKQRNANDRRNAEAIRVAALSQNLVDTELAALRGSHPGE